MSKPVKVQILERARALIADERHWCPGDLARDAMAFQSAQPTTVLSSVARWGHLWRRPMKSPAILIWRMILRLRR
jgi:hypothetical protein